MDFKNHELPKFNQNEMENLHSLKIIKEIECLIKKHLKKKFSDPEVIAKDLYKTFEELTPILSNLFSIIKRKHIRSYL